MHKRLDSAGLKAALVPFCGTEVWHRHLLTGMLYTDGVKFFADEGGTHGAYWFLDLVLSEYRSLQRERDFLIITLAVKDGKAEVIVDDGDDTILSTLEISFTDMQAGEWKFYFVNDVLLLPGEY